MCEKVGKSRNTVFFQWFGAPEGRKVGSLKRRVRSQLARWEMKICTPLWRETHFRVKMCKTPGQGFGPLLEVAMSKKCTLLWREAHFQVKMYKTPGVRSTFGSCDVEKVHAVVARSTFPSQNVQNTRGSDHFWKLRCRKSARRCGAKHISKSKCTKHTRSGPLLEVPMSKKRTPLWREAHFQVKMYKAHHARTTFGGSDVEKVYVVVARRTFRSQNVQNTPLWRETHFRVKMYKTPGVRTTFGSCDVEKVHAVVARSTFPSQNVQNTRGPDHFWKLRCRKSARRCGAKHISKSKCTKHTRSGPLLEVEMSKKCTPLWREAHFQVKMCKTPHARATFGGSDVEKVHAVVARSTFPSQNVQNARGSDHFWSFRCRFTKLHYTPLHSTTLNSTTLQLELHNYTTTLHYTPLHSTTLNYTTLHYTKLHYTTLHYTPLHYITLHYTTFHYTSLHYTTLHSTTLQLQLHNYTPLH